MHWHSSGRHAVYSMNTFFLALSLNAFRQVFLLFSHMNQNILDRNWIRSIVRYTHKML